MVKEPSLLGVIVILAVVILRLIEFLFKKVLMKEKKKSALTNEERMYLKDIHEIVNEKDSDGIPKVFMPRELAVLQRELVQNMTRISATQEKTAYILESLSRGADRIEDKIDRIKRVERN